MRKEFLLIFCFVFLLLPLIPQRVVDLEAMRGQPITVTIEGAVREPVTLECPPYTELGELLDQVTLLDDADLSPFSMTMIVKDHDVIQIPHFQETPRISINTASRRAADAAAGSGAGDGGKDRGLPRGAWFVSNVGRSDAGAGHQAEEMGSAEGVYMLITTLTRCGGWFAS